MAPGLEQDQCTMQKQRSHGYNTYILAKLKHKDYDSSWMREIK